MGLPRSCYSGCWADRDVAGGAARGWARWGGKLFILCVNARDDDNDDDEAGTDEPLVCPLAAAPSALLEGPCPTLLCIGRKRKVRQD